MGAKPKFCKTWTMPPPARDPNEIANAPTRLYQAKTFVRFSSDIICERAACSIDRNGPTSLPVGLMTPIIAAINNKKKLLVELKTTPARIINPDPIISIRRLPILSA